MPARSTRSRLRRRHGRAVLGLAAGALLAGTLTTGPATDAASAAGAEPFDYTIDVDASDTGAQISDTMYGIFFEDINHAADGGIYAELVENRSFEYAPIDNDSYTSMTAWDETAVGGATGEAQVVNDDQRLNEMNRNYLQLRLDGTGSGGGAGFGVTSQGYNEGIPVEAGEKYDFSVWARTDAAAATPLNVTLHDASGTALATPLRVSARGDRWTKYAGTFTARESSPNGRLSVLAGGGGTVRLDMVSLFPQDTFRGRENGLRRDLAEQVAELKPDFVRFPGGCLVNTGSHQAYQAPDFPRERSFQWKDTIGPVEQRPTNANFWGYNQTYGLGYYEYFQFAEDIGAMALPVVPALVTGCGQNRATDDPELLRRHIQDTLDLIEFANGPASSEWGSVRAEMGHPKPFGLTHVSVGNEENLGDAFFERFLQFRDAIKAAHPEITVISNSGPDDAGENFDHLWELNRSAGVDMVDEHYYNSPSWFLENNERYDSYDRQGPDVFLGEYASLDNRYFNALAEASYMTGLERNADVVKLASYAPLLASDDDSQWRPDMIWFNNNDHWGSTSYEVQRLFSRNTGDEVVPSQASTTPGTLGPITGAVGLSTWATSAAYDDVKVTSADGETLLQDDFSGDDSQWTNIANRGSWAIEDGQFVQSDTGAENTMVTAGDTDWTNYDLEVTATKRSGREGFLVGFGVKDTGNFYWWNIGGWNNTQTAVEESVDGGKQTLIPDGTSVETGRAYDLRIEVRDRTVTLFIDGQEWGSFTDDSVAEPFRQVVTRDEATGDMIVKVVNAQESPARTDINLGDEVDVASTARLTTLQGDPDAVNTATSRPIQPRNSMIDGVSNQFTHTFPPYSVTFMRIATIN